MSFPDDGALARALFEEGVRHLQDARVLHGAGRYPAAIASSMKAAELGFKAFLILGGAFGWWENVVTSHSPVTDANGHPVLKHMTASLPRSLMADVIGMERLAPARLGRKAFSSQDELNPEYPFVLVQGVDITIGKPSDYFHEQDSQRYYETASRLLAALTSQSSAIGGWVVALPDPLT